jgi:hypothetical protein
MNTIYLTGTVLEWLDDASVNVEASDGDITLQPKSDMQGRAASLGGHTNYGLSGYWKGYVYLKGRRRRLVDWYKLFPESQHHFAAQQDARAAVQRITDVIQGKAGAGVTKVMGGYAFDPNSNAVDAAPDLARKVAQE